MLRETRRKISPAAIESLEKGLQYQEPYVVKLADNERLTGEVSQEHLAEAICAMHGDGLVVLENAVDITHVDKLNSILCEEAVIMEKLPTTHFNDVS